MARHVVVVSNQPQTHNPEYFVELREHHPRGEPGTYIVPPSTQRNRSHPQRNGVIIDPRDHGVWKATQVTKKTGEYEDIYNGRVQPGISKNSYRHSLREGRGRGGYMVINERLKISRYPPDARTQRDSMRSVSSKDKREQRGLNGVYVRENRNVVDRRDTKEIRFLDGQRDVRGTRMSTDDNNVVDIRDSRHVNVPEGLSGTRNSSSIGHNGIIANERTESKNNSNDTRYTEDQRRETGTSMVDKRDSPKTEEEKEFSNLQWNPHQTSFLRKQSSAGEQVSGNGIIELDDRNPPPHVVAAVIHKPSNPNSGITSDSDSSGTTSPNFLNVPNPRLVATTRSISPANSIVSDTSYQSHMTQNSATSAKSEVSVKSILKKPKVGRVILKEEPSAYNVLAILSCIFCFPFGIYALVKSSNVKTAVEENDYDWALSSSKKVKHFCIGIVLVYLGILAIGGGFLANYLIAGKVF